MADLIRFARWLRHRWYSSRVCYAWYDRCWRCLINPFHGDERR